MLSVSWLLRSPRPPAPWPPCSWNTDAIEASSAGIQYQHGRRSGVHQGRRACCPGAPGCRASARADAVGRGPRPDAARRRGTQRSDGAGRGPRANLRAVADLKQPMTRLVTLGPSLDATASLAGPMVRVADMRPSLDAVARLQPSLDQVASLDPQLASVAALQPAMKGLGTLRQPLERVAALEEPMSRLASLGSRCRVLDCSSSGRWLDSPPGAGSPSSPSASPSSARRGPPERDWVAG